MEYGPKKRVRVAFIDAAVKGLGWHGRAVDVEPGAYKVAELDGMQDGIVMLQEPDGKLLAMVEESSVAEFREVLDGEYSVDWAVYYRANPQALASWGEQNGRKP